MVMKPDLDKSGSPKLAIFLWVDDGTVRQVRVDGQQRRALLEFLSRISDFSPKVSDQTYKLQWPKEEEASDASDAELSPSE